MEGITSLSPIRLRRSGRQERIKLGGEASRLLLALAQHPPPLPLGLLGTSLRSAGLTLSTYFFQLLKKGVEMGTTGIRMPLYRVAAMRCDNG